jgi:hypothetical protein
MKLELHDQMFRFHLAVCLCFYGFVYLASEHKVPTQNTVWMLVEGRYTVNQTSTVYVCHSVIRRLDFMGISNWKVEGKSKGGES